MNRRGHALLLVMVVLSATLTLGSVVVLRTQAGIRDRPRAAQRTQAIWLGRTALRAGIRGQQRVETEWGQATVTVRPSGAGHRAVVDLAGAQAVVTSEPYAERYRPSPLAAP